jgi:hypothetical protein
MNNPILEEYARKYKPEELTHDGIPNIETQLREMQEQDEKQQIDKINHRREMIQRVKCISLFIMGKDIMTNTLNLNKKDREKLQEIMHLYNDTSDEDIIDKFNTVVNEVLFENDKVDLSKLPIYSYNK